jgi:hypothetical protein
MSLSTVTKLTAVGVFSLLSAPMIFAAPGQTTTPGCSVPVAENATISGNPAAVGTDIFNGELLQTQNNGSLVVQCGSVRLALASNASMRVFQAGTKTSVELERGIVAYSTAGRSEDLALYGLDVKIVPNTQQPSVGQVDVSSHCELSVQSGKSTAAVTSDKETKTVEEGKAYDVTPKLGVDYSDDWRPVPEDYPDFPREAKYHDSHHHVACVAAAETAQNAAPNPAVSGGDFHLIVAGAGLAALGGISYHLWDKLSESPYKPADSH